MHKLLTLLRATFSSHAQTAYSYPEYLTIIMDIPQLIALKEKLTKKLKNQAGIHVSTEIAISH